MQNPHNHNNTGIHIQPSQDGLYEVKNDTKTGVENTLETRESCKYKTVKTRVYFVRHGSTHEDEHNKQENLHIPQTPQASLSGKGHEEMYRVGKEFVEMGLTKENTLFLYSDDTTRVQESLEDILKNFGLNGVVNDLRLQTSKKDIDPSTGQAQYFKNRRRLQVDLGVSQQTIALMEDLIANVDYQKYRHIVLIGHKSNQPGITQSVSNKDKGFDGCIDIPNGGIIEVDIPEGIDDYVDHAREKDLFINNGNYVAIRDTIKGVITIDTQDVIDFQNKLNVHFINHPELFQTYAFHENDDLRWFCIYHLIKLGDLQTLNQIFQKKEFRDKIILKNLKHLSAQEYEVLRYYKQIYPQVLLVRAKSLDARINKGEDIDAHFGFSNTTYDANPLALVSSGKEIKYIEAKAGAGKSFLLAQLAEKLHAKNMEQESTTFYHPYYINLSGKGLEVFSGFPSDDTKASIVYLIDSIDESNIHGSDRKLLDEKLLELSKTGKVIITSRNGYRVSYAPDERKMSEEISEAQEIVELLDFDSTQRDTYLEGYFSQDTGKIPQAKEILSKLNGAGNNPLLLCMVCEVVKAGGIKDEDGNILSLEGISIIKIYENIVRLRLIDYNIQVQKRDVKTRGNKETGREKALNKKSKTLSKIGYVQMFEAKIFSLEELEDEIDDENLDIETLNLLFRISEGEYEFVHQSFKEYFASKYVFEEMKNNKDFDFEVFLCQKLKQVDVNFLEMLCEFVERDKNVKEIFLNMIDKNESFFPQSIHHKIVFILGKLDEVKMEEYLERVKNTSDIFEILVRYGGEERIKKSMKEFQKLKDNQKQKALQVLGKYGGELGICMIRERFQDFDNYDDRVKIDAISTLCEFGGQDGVNFIIKKFLDFSPPFKNLGVSCIGKYGGDESIKFLIEQFGKHNNSSLDKNVLEMLGEYGGEEGRKFLILCLNNLQDDEIKGKIIFLLGRHGGVKFIEHIVSIFDSLSNTNQGVAIDTIGEYGGDLGKEFLIEKFEKLTGDLQLQSMIGLCKNGSMDSIHFLIGKYDTFHLTVKNKFVIYLCKLCKYVDTTRLDFLEKIYDDLTDTQKWEVLYYLGKYAGEPGSKFVLERFNDLFCEYSFKDYRYGSLSLELIIRSTGDPGQKFLKERFYGYDDAVKVEIIYHYGKYKGAEFIGFLENEFDKMNPEIKCEAIGVLCDDYSGKNISFIFEKIESLHMYPGGKLMRYLGRFGGAKGRMYMKGKIIGLALDCQIEYLKSICIVGGKDNIEFIKSQIHIEALQKTIIEILSSVGGRDNLAFIEKYKHLLEENQ